MNENFLIKAIDLSSYNVHQGGGPFGAVIVKDDQIIAYAANSVTLLNDPTAHAEIVAIRNACKTLNTFQLHGCILYSSCEPCPMCLGAIYWAHIDIVYFVNTKEDAAAIDFDDSFIYHELTLSHQDRTIPFIQVDHPNALHAFNLWQSKKDKISY